MHSRILSLTATLNSHFRLAARDTNGNPIKVSQDIYDYKMIPDGAMAEAAGRKRLDQILAFG